MTNTYGDEYDNYPDLIIMQLYIYQNITLYSTNMCNYYVSIKNKVTLEER